MEAAETRIATPEEIVLFVRRNRWNLNNEKALQTTFETRLAAEGYAFEREYRLNPGDIPDFFFPMGGGRGFVLEVKIKGSKRAIYDQCARYCRHPDVAGLVLATNVPTGFPPDIDGIPCWVASLGVGWL